MIEGQLAVNKVPDLETDTSQTGYCPPFDPEPWKDTKLTFQDKLFVRATTRGVMHIPLNIGRVFVQTFVAIESADAIKPPQAIVLSRDLSTWTGEHLFAATQAVPGQELVRLSGDFRTRAFEGPYRDAAIWYQAILDVAADDTADVYLFYTTCPKCAKRFGKNQIVGFVKIS